MYKCTRSTVKKNNGIKQREKNILTFCLSTELRYNITGNFVCTKLVDKINEIFDGVLTRTKKNAGTRNDCGRTCIKYLR